MFKEGEEQMVHFELRYIIYHPLLKVCIKETKHDVVCLLNIHRFTLLKFTETQRNSLRDFYHHQSVH